MRCDDLGPDLLAKAVGQIGPDEAVPLDAHLAACPACRAELDRLAREVAAAVSAVAGPAAPAGPALRSRVLAAVAASAADRRADATAEDAVASAASCPDLREDLPALALGQTDDAVRARLEAHVAACAACADEVAVIRRLLAAHRAAAAASPAVAAGLRDRVLAAARTSRAAPAPPPPPPPAAPVHDLGAARRRALVRAAAVPLAAAATILVAIALTPPAIGLHVQDDVGALFRPGRPDALPNRWIDRDAGEVRFAPGDGVAAGERPVEIRLRFAGRSASDPSAERPNRGEVRIRLEPQTEIVRTDDACFELRSGKIAVHAGALDARLSFRHGRLRASVLGTRFDAAVVGERLVVSVQEGRVEVAEDVLEADGAARERSLEIGPGEDALVDGERLLRRRSDGTPAADAFLAPRASVAVRTPSIRPDGALEVDAELRPGEGGPVTVPAFDDSDPRFLVRLKGPDGRVLDVKVQRSMLVGAERAPPSVRLDGAAPYRLRVRIDGLNLAPGAWEASLRVQACGGRSDGAEWHGTAESPPAPFQVTPE